MSFPERICDYCEETFEPIRKNQRFCRTVCRRAYHSKTLKQLLKETLEPLQFLASLPEKILPIDSRSYPQRAAALARIIREMPDR
jgi:hypothetical protein